ncbi:MAG: hypothetical protein R3F62_20890 [Planctomycetota bacterium]
MTDSHDWPLDPAGDAERAELKGLGKWFAAGLGTAIAILAATGPNLVEARGATPGLVFDRAQRQRCMELGLTPDELHEYVELGAEGQ